MKVKLLKNHDIDELELEINNWLNQNSNVRIIDVKITDHLYRDSYYLVAMICYN